jgi:tRNA1Val (adenine37-N6)-methyltransferase
MFSFKKFNITQQNTAMKVCTDTCIFGASILSTDPSKLGLDIGTGTGVLALMCAQKNQNLRIHALEIDPLACKDANLNFKNSPFQNQISLFNTSIQEFSKNVEKKYDLIFSNPPFYENHLKSDNKAKNIAFHAEELSLTDLVNAVQELLSDKGDFWILYPPITFQKCIKAFEAVNIFLELEIEIFHDSEKPCFRKIGKFNRYKGGETTFKKLYIYENQKYSEKFKELLKDYYLIF